jgi:antitoxin (DNA-binding transcriptional repressor) of toxin-antitoxin stability system
MAKTIPAEIPVRLLDVIDDADVVITKAGQVIARVVPIDHRPRRHLTLEELRAAGRVVGDILEPVDEWDVEKATDGTTRA